jgi:hypothetical protein
MMLPLIVRPEAEADITDQALWYEEKRFGLGNEFLDEIQTALKKSKRIPNTTDGFGGGPMCDGLFRNDSHFGFFTY